MTFEDWFGTGHRLDDHDKQVAELMRMAWNMADKSARNECAEICNKIQEGMMEVAAQPVALGALNCKRAILETIK